MALEARRGGGMSPPQEEGERTAEQRSEGFQQESELSESETHDWENITVKELAEVYGITTEEAQVAIKQHSKADFEQLRTDGYGNPGALTQFGPSTKGEGKSEIVSGGFAYSKEKLSQFSLTVALSILLVLLAGAFATLEGAINPLVFSAIGMIGIAIVIFNIALWNVVR